MRERRAYIVLVGITVVLSVLTFFLSVRNDISTRNQLENLQQANNEKFCDVIGSVIVTPVPKPADPKANPSRERSWVLYKKFVKLDESLGCRRAGERGQQ